MIMTAHDPSLPGAPLARQQPYARLRLYALIGATAIGLYISYLIALPFLPALLWALTAAVLAMPLQRRLEAMLKRPSLAAAVTLALLCVLVLLPLILVGNQLVTALVSGLTSLQEQAAGSDVRRVVEAHWLTRRLISLAPADLDLSSIFGNVTGWVAGLGASVVRGSLTNMITAVLAIYLVFYFLRDHRDILHEVREHSPLTTSETNYLFGRVADIIRAIMLGTVVTSAVQGALGGAMFWLLGLPDPVFWGIVMAFAAIVPILGAFVVWLPAAVYLALGGDWGKAAVLAAWGTVVIGGIDNILYPILAGGRLRLHTVPTFIAIVGGLALFGASGLILGPLVIVLTLAILHIWRERADTAGANETNTAA
jgi:predicted PurR-regulated permease PerM